MGKYSQADLLKEELSLIGSSDLFGRFLQKMNKTSRVLLTIDVPKNLFLRAEVFWSSIPSTIWLSARHLTVYA